jgi:hypothetical protein
METTTEIHTNLQLDEPAITIMPPKSNSSSPIDIDSSMTSLRYDNGHPSTLPSPKATNTRSPYQRSGTRNSPTYTMTGASISSKSKSVTPPTTSSNDGNGIISGSKSWLSVRTANTITAGLLLYMVCFQFTASYFYQHITQGESDRTISGSRFISTSFVASTDRRDQQKQSTGCMGNKNRPYRPMISPPQQEPEPVEWKVRSEVTLKELTYPVFMTSMPKSGTTSLWKFFQCGNQKSSHNWIKKRSSSKSTLSGQCIQENIVAGKPPFHNCGDFDVFTDTGVSLLHVVYS